jgi:ribosomal protein S25
VGRPALEQIKTAGKALGAFPAQLVKKVPSGLFRQADLHRLCGGGHFFAHHSTKLDEEEVKQKLAEYFKAHSFLQRRDFERLTGFNSSKSTRVIRELVKDGVLKNAGTKFQPVYVVGEKG